MRGTLGPGTRGSYAGLAGFLRGAHLENEVMKRDTDRITAGLRSQEQ